MKNYVNTFEINGNTLYIMRDGWDKVVETTYREDYVDEIKSHVWSLKKDTHIMRHWVADYIDILWRSGMEKKCLKK